MREQYMRNGEGFMLVFDVTSRTSFEELRDIHARLLRVNDAAHMPVVVVGNKTDLPNRQVKEDEARAFAKKIQGTYVETSAKMRLNIEDAFFALVRAMRAAKAPAPKASELGTKAREQNKKGGMCSVL